MQAIRFIRKAVSLNIVEVTLLSIEEAARVPEKLRAIGRWWWLRSPGMAVARACYVGRDGSTSPVGYYVGNSPYENEEGSCIGVRPALVIGNLKALNFVMGEEIELAGHRWTIISGNMALCNDVIGEQEFRKYLRTEHDSFTTKDGSSYPLVQLNKYEYSDVKAFLDEWAFKNGLLVRQAA